MVQQLTKRGCSDRVIGSLHQIAQSLTPTTTIYKPPAPAGNPATGLKPQFALHKCWNIAKASPECRHLLQQQSFPRMLTFLAILHPTKERLALATGLLATVLFLLWMFVPCYSTVRITTVPVGAEVRANGDIAGITPLAIRLRRPLRQ